MAQERRLGRGLGSLIPTRDSDGPAQEIPLARIRPNPFQPRGTFDPEELAELQQSIEAHGVLQPVLVRPAGDHYELVSGERRFRASQAAGRKTIPAVIRQDVDDESMLELALVENLQRSDLDPLEKARGFRRLIEKLQLTQEQVAEKVGLRRSTVTNHLRLLELPGKVQEEVAQGRLSMGHARALLGLKDSRAQERLAEEAMAHGLSVRQVESRCRQLQGKSEPSPAAPTRTKVVPPAWVQDFERRIRDRLGTQVQVRPGAGERGQIVLHYHDRAELERLIGVLAPQPRME